MKMSAEELLAFFLTQKPDHVEEVNFVVIDSSRSAPRPGLFTPVIKDTPKDFEKAMTERRWREKPATLRLAVPDEVVKNMRGADDQRDWYVLLRVDRGVLEQLESPIIQPEIVKP